MQPKILFRTEENFDEYNDLTEIISYDHKSIDVFYKQPGYLQLNKRKLINSKILLGFDILLKNSIDINEALKKLKIKSISVSKMKKRFIKL